MKNLIERLLLFVFAVPAVMVLPLVLYHFNFLALFLVCGTVFIIAIYEVHKILKHSYSVYHFSFFICVALLNFVFLYFFTYNKIKLQTFLLGFVISIFSLVILEIIVSQRHGFEKSLERILTGVFILLYPIWLGDFFLMLTQLQRPRLSIAIFFIIIISCDSLAWLFGMLFGKGNRGIIAASPKKSVAGFVGVAVSILLLSVLAYYFAPNFLSFPRTLIVMGITHLFAVVGDLFESLLKRAVNVKDSGSIVMGRGGILDTIDSLLLAAPAYFFLCNLFL
ncbi:MAG: phosphatidate cytidylyltransferase [Spirochaetaceae bacterium]|nr:phosphatidate cytidylyltransferase [Spirochaetaceae bacterium]